MFDVFTNTYNYYPNYLWHFEKHIWYRLSFFLNRIEISFIEIWEIFQLGKIQWSNFSTIVNPKNEFGHI
jgi:hypothetical protein